MLVLGDDGEAARPAPAAAAAAGRCIFFSHAWAPVSVGRDTHARVLGLARDLGTLGWRTWVDERAHLAGHLDVALACGMRASDAVVVCLTRAYCDKVDAAAAAPLVAEDNCFKELMLAAAWRKAAVPVLFDPAVRDWARWGPVLCMRLGGHVYVDADAPNAARALHRCLCALFAGGPRRGLLLAAGAGRARTAL